MISRRTVLKFAPALFPLILAACNFPTASSGQPPGPELILTYAAQTVEAQLTADASGLQPTFTPGGLLPTPAPSGGETPEPTPQPGSTDVAVEETSTPEVPCDRASFEGDVNYPDNTEVDPGEQFTKTWRLKNTGSCTWNTNYSIVFDEGDSMGAPASAPLTDHPVEPGDEVEVSLDLTAPDSPGTYQGFWKLRNSAGEVFGVGSNADKNFWVKIKVKGENQPAEGEVASGSYDFIAQASKAKWVGSGGGSDVDLTFGGADDDPNGVAKLKEDITLENGSEAGKTLITHPKHNDDGKITGTFSEFKVEDGDHFKAKLGFLEDCGNGQVIFQLWYKEGDNTQMLQEWHEACDGHLTFADVDLSDLSGKTVQFVLVVLADGSPEDDLAIWGSARIES